jgi:hypothetical protein
MDHEGQYRRLKPRRGQVKAAQEELMSLLTSSG